MTGADPASELQAELDGTGDVVALLTEAESAELLELFHRARISRRTALDAAVHELLQNLPRLIRLPARKILFGQRTR